MKPLVLRNCWYYWITSTNNLLVPQTQWYHKPSGTRKWLVQIDSWHRECGSRFSLLSHPSLNVDIRRVVITITIMLPRLPRWDDTKPLVIRTRWRVGSVSDFGEQCIRVEWIIVFCHLNYCNIPLCRPLFDPFTNWFYKSSTGFGVGTISNLFSNLL
jgi:hypothetical protein